MKNQNYYLSCKHKIFSPLDIHLILIRNQYYLHVTHSISFEFLCFKFLNITIGDVGILCDNSQMLKGLFQIFERFLSCVPLTTSYTAESKPYLLLRI